MMDKWEITLDTWVESLVFRWHVFFNYLSPAVSLSLFHELSLGFPWLFQQTCEKVQLNSVAACFFDSLFCKLCE